MKVLLVEDSLAITAYVERLLRAEEDVALLPVARDGRAGVEAVHREAPDVVLLDLELPVLHGIDAIREIMATRPTPIVVLSSYLDAPDRDRTFESLEAGAVDVLAKPRGLGEADVARFRRRLLSSLRLMAQARVIRRRGLGPARAALPPPGEAVAPGPGVEAVLVGSSTGGPPLLHAILAAIPPPLAVPVLVAQHLMPGFEAGLADWLAQTGHAVRVAAPGDPLRPGEVLLARPDRHLVVLAGGVVGEEPADPAASAPLPSVDRLFSSGAEALGERAAGLLLTGMGEDGARGLLRLRHAGAPTVAQRGDTCTIDGMPAAARRLGAAAQVLAPAEIAGWLGSLGPANAGEPRARRGGGPARADRPGPLLRPTS